LGQARRHAHLATLINACLLLLLLQVGSGAQDHAIWGRPEDVKGPVPAYVVTPSAPGSDVVGAMGGALAAASEAFKNVDPAYSTKLLAAAIKAYQ
jgi:hypothetical protein